jgi:hypothetical protein
MRYLFIIVFFGSFIGCNQKVEKKPDFIVEASVNILPDVESINKLIKKIIESDSFVNEGRTDSFLNPRLFSSENYLGILQRYIDTTEYLTEEDKEYIVKQNIVFNGLVLNSVYFDSSITERFDRLKFFYDYKTPNGFTRKYSVPAFSLDGKYVFVEVGYGIGFMCGTGFLVVYKIENGKIEEVDRIELWIS